MLAEAGFWEHVERDEPPQLDGSESSAEALQSIYPASNGETAVLFGRDNALKEYMELRNQKKTIDNRIGKIENVIKADMGTAELGTCGRFKISWKSQTRQTFQPKVFAKDYPTIDLAPYFKTTSLRPFKVTEAAREAV